MSDEAVAHHPAPERLKLLSSCAFKQYRDTLPAQPTALPWAEGNKSKDGVAMTALLAHYAAAENAAAYIADASQGDPQSARSEVTRSSTAPTADHAYTSSWPMSITTRTVRSRSRKPRCSAPPTGRRPRGRSIPA